MTRILLFRTCMLYTFLAAVLVQAQDTVSKGPVTVSATRIPTQTLSTGRSMHVLTRSDIEAIPVASVDELLRYVPGLETQARGPFGTQADIIIRGSTFSQVLVLIDGMRVNDPLTGHFNGYMPVSLAEIERIEVLRGPSAALYGVDAVGGVVHIITKTFAYGAPVDSSSMYTGELGGGSHGLAAAQLGAVISSGNLLFAGGVTTYASTGYPRVGEPPADFTLLTGSASLRSTMTDGWSTALRVATDAREFDARYYYTRSSVDQSREQVQTLWTQAMLQKEDAASTVRLDVSYKRLRDIFNFNPTFPSINTHTTQYFNTMLTGHLLVTDQLSIGAGLQADYRTIISTDRGDHETGHLGLYVLGSYFLDRLTANASFRVDYDQNYDWQFAPQLSAAYQAGLLTLRGSVGRSVRAADYTERFVSTNIPPPLTPGRNLGNPNLEAEQSWTWDIGADARIHQWLQLSGSYFARDGSNLIDYVITNSNDIWNNTSLVPDTTYFYAQNIASVTTQGLEVEASGLLDIAPLVRLTYSIGYLMLDIESDSDQVSKYISSTARQLGNGRLGLDVGRFNLGIQGIYKVRDAEDAEVINATLSGSYVVFNASARYRILDAIGAFIQVNNVADVRYGDILGAQMPGRWVVVGVLGGFTGVPGT